MNSRFKLKLGNFVIQLFIVSSGGIRKLDDDFINVFRDVRPRHQIVLVYPACKQRDEIDEFSYNINEELGEKTILRHDNMSKRLCDLLALRVEQYQVTKTIGAITQVDDKIV
ncbi:unnamed protein product [Onchocerca flexuosa]|uniref:Polyphosphate kinase n=1 Tax=Onchocerca flexuosa TaxID=387005 RepID=A0A183HER0_9BILA|nr:unnamed protein product [Onchocerca flexuosa]